MNVENLMNSIFARKKRKTEKERPLIGKNNLPKNDTVRGKNKKKATPIKTEKPSLG